RSERAACRAATAPTSRAHLRLVRGDPRQPVGPAGERVVCDPDRHGDVVAYEREQQACEPALPAHPVGRDRIEPRRRRIAPGLAAGGGSPLPTSPAESSASNPAGSIASASPGCAVIAARLASCASRVYDSIVSPPRSAGSGASSIGAGGGGATNPASASLGGGAAAAPPTGTSSTSNSARAAGARGP